MKRYFFAFCFAFLAFGCSKEEPIKIDPKLQPYFDLFVSEAARFNRVLTEDEKNIRLVFSNIARSEVLGQCTYNDDLPNLVEIDVFTWRTLDPDTKEFLIFHELGHCVLNRPHRDGSNSNGRCLSIMHSTLGSCDYEFAGAEKERLLMELFN